MTARAVAIGSFLTPAERGEPVDRRATYQMMGVRSFGRGPFAAAQLSGDATSYSTLRKVDEGDVVYPKLMAWEGAFAMVSPELAGRWVSPEFCIFEVDETVANRGYVSHLLAWEGLRGGLVGESSGTNARRRRLQPTSFLAHFVALPDLPAQRRIVRHLDRLADSSLKVAGSDLRHLAAEQALVDRTFSALAGYARPIGEVIKLARDSIEVDPAETYRTLGLLNRGRGVFARGAMSGSDTKYRHYFRVKTDQLIYSKLFGWEGSVAVIPRKYDGHYVSAEFPTFDLDPSLALPSYVDHIVTWAGFTSQLAYATTGMGQRRQRVNVADFEAIEVPIPELAEQRRVIAHLNKLASISKLVQRRAGVASALLPAARDEVFSALR